MAEERVRGECFFPFCFSLFFSYFSESDATQRPSFFPSDVWTQFSPRMEFIDDRVLMSAHFYTAFPEMWFFLLLLLMLPLFALGRFFFLLAISAQEAIKCYQAASKIHTKRQSIDNDRAWVIKSKVKVIVIMFCYLEVCIAKGRRKKKHTHIEVWLWGVGTRREKKNQLIWILLADLRQALKKNPRKKNTQNKKKGDGLLLHWTY